TSPSSAMSTPSCCPELTVTPEFIGSVFFPSRFTACESLRAPVCGVEVFGPGLAGSCGTTVLILISTGPCQVTVWTTWLTRTVSPRTGITVEVKIVKTAANTRTARDALRWGFLMRDFGAVKFILFEQPG